MSDLPGADHDTSRWSVCAAAVVPGQPVAGPDGQAAERNHPEVLHASDAGKILVNPLCWFQLDLESLKSPLSSFVGF